MRTGRLGIVLVGLAAALLGTAATSYPNDPFYTEGNQWALRQIGAPYAWCASTGSGITVADATTGVEISHPDLAGKAVAGAAFTSGGGNAAHPDGTGASAVADVAGPGTADAGVIGASTGNGIGVASVAPSARVLAMRVIDANLFAQMADLPAATEWAVAHGSRVVVFDFATGVTYFGNAGALVTAAQYASSHGAVVVIASGNAQLGGMSAMQLQALDQVALVTGALDPNGQPASYVTNGNGVNIYAPGGDTQRGRYQDIHHLVVTTGRHSDYVEVEGTYLAAAHVAGAVADLLAHGASAQQAHDRLVSTGAQPNGLSYLNLAAALGTTRACGSPVAPSAPKAGAAAAPAAAPAAATAAAADAAAADNLGVNTAQTPADYHWVAYVVPPLALVLLGGGLLMLINRRR